MLFSGGLFGFLFGLFKLLTDLLVHNWLHAIVYGAGIGLFTGAAFGFCMALILLPFHYYCFYRVVDKQFPPLSLEATQQEKTFIIGENILHLWSSCVSGLKTSKNYNVIKENFALNQILIMTPKSFKGYGEKMTISLYAIDENRTKLVIASKPKWWTTLIDYGKNYENIVKALRLIVAQSHPSVVIRELA
ncbi:MAG: hypothetical protein K0Q50_1042 [Vampirovibrio sp.]|jgi:hypothetical protein|nr:hypothetical protein [Vampirovibrio sp.]